MAKAKKYQYRIQYIDNTYQLVDWTKTEFELAAKGMADYQRAVVVGNDVFKVEDIRAIVYLPPLPEPTPEEKKAQEESQLSEWGFTDPQTQEWLRSQGIKLGGENG